MPKQVPKQCRWCEYTAGNGGALSSHAKTKHPDEWEAFKSEQASAKPSERPALSTTEVPEDDPMAGFRFTVTFNLEVDETDVAAWRPTCDDVYRVMSDAMRVLFTHAAEIPLNVALLSDHQSFIRPTRSLQQEG